MNSGPVGAVFFGACERDGFIAAAAAADNETVAAAFMRCITPSVRPSFPVSVTDSVVRPTILLLPFVGAIDISD